MHSIQLIVGLQNPGKKYASTRHNAGAWWVEKICAIHNISLNTNNKLHASIGTGNINGLSFRCAIPTTYMNHSGNAVKAIATYYNIAPEEILIVHDDLDLTAGIIKLKVGGGHGGHNGLRDIMPQLASKNFIRLRVGIGHPGEKSLVSDYVLKAPSKQEAIQINLALEQAIQVFPLDNSRKDSRSNE